MIKTSVSGIQDVKAELREELEKLTGGAQVVLVGIHEEESDPEGPLTMAQLGAVHEFGAEIDHPGGTAYGYATKEDAEAGRVRFLKEREGYMVLGETQPHRISIPERPWLTPGVEKGEDTYLKILEDGVAKDEKGETILNKIGVIAEGNAKSEIIEVKAPPNAPSTIRKKGSSNPLVDTGAMMQSVHYSLSKDIPEE